MANTTKTKWKNSYLTLNALRSDVQLCNSCYMGKGFSLKRFAPCVRRTLRTAAMATMYLLWQRRRKGGERKKEINGQLNGEKEVPVPAELS